MINWILWDIDGTLLDFLAAEKYAIRKCFSLMGMGVCTDEMLARYSALNRQYWKRMEAGEITRQEVLIGRFRAFFETEGLDVSKAEEFNLRYQYHLGDHAVFLPHAKETVLQMKKEYRQCAVTNGTALAQSRKLRASGLDRLLDAVFISEKMGYEKPNRRFFDSVFAALNAAREETVLIGDSLTSDIQGAMNAGIRSVLYNPGGNAVPAAYSPDYTVRDLAEIPALPLFQKK